MRAISSLLVKLTRISSLSTIDFYSGIMDDLGVFYVNLWYAVVSTSLASMMNMHFLQTLRRVF